MNRKRGFTLLELLIVIAMLAILAVVIILIINPAEILRKGRDSQRLSDLSTLKTALALYLLRAPNPQLDGGGDGTCGTNIWIGRPPGSAEITDTSVSGRPLTTNGDRTSTAIDGTGWIPVNFTEIPEGSPIGNLPVDPNYSVADATNVANSDFYYSYSCDTDSTFELNANMESAAFSLGGSNDKESLDGGNAELLEVGTKLSMLSSSLDLQIGANTDDVSHNRVDHQFRTDLSVVGIGFFSGIDRDWENGQRFTNVTIPQSATINVAFLTLTASQNRTGTGVVSTIFGDDTDSAATFSDDTDWHNRTRTAASVAWNNVEDWAVDVEYNSPSVVSVIRGIVDRTNWASGNALAILWEENNSTVGRNAYSFNADPAKAPKLHIEYTVP